MRVSSIRPPKRIEIKLPSDFSDKFLMELSSSIDFDERGFKGEYLKEHLFSKYCGPSTTPASVRSTNAIEKWLGTERRNAKTNVRLFEQNGDFGWIVFPDFVCRVKSLISRILGPVRYPDVLMDIVHTNGASTRVRRSSSAAVHKLEGEAHVSASALKHWFATASSTRLSEQTLVLQESSVLFTVPKRSDIDRVACKEPEINMLLQRSVGSFIRRRLRRYGINLNDQSVNRRLAADAVKNGLATIDLSSASDSISSQLVALLLPFEWWSLLDDLRVKTTLIDGELHDLEMFSSMGNGFTFELESLLFYAITSVVCRVSRVKGRISVYGDDIIAPCAIVPRLIRMFHYCGFKTNSDKTFWTGQFRESCGGHYHRGRDVTPFFVRRPVSTVADLILVLNSLLKWECRGIGFFEDQSLLDFHYRYSQFVPQYLWGGVDPEDSTCLVTGHRPRYRLTPKTRPVAYHDKPALTHWFMTKESTERPFSTGPTDVIAYKATRVSRGWTTSWKPWFLKGN